MNIILFYQHIGRELFSIRKLKRILEKIGNSVFVFSIDFELDYAIRTAKRTKIDVIVSPWMYHDTNYEEFVPIIKTNPQIKIINLHSEQVYSPFSRLVLLPAKGVASDNVYHFCWGENFKNELMSVGVAEELIYVTGSMRNDEAFETSYKKNELAEKYNLNPNKKWILFAENRNFVKNSDPINSDFVKKGISEDTLIDRFNFTKKQLEGTINDINSLSESFFDVFELIYRSHPGFQGDMGITNDKVREIADLSIYEWLNSADACVVWNSTTAFESDMMKVPVFVCSIDPIPEIYKTVGLKNYAHIKHLDELLNVDFKKNLDRQNDMKNYSFYYGEVDGNATANVANAIEDVFNKECFYVAKIIPRKKYYHFKKWVSVKLMRVLIRLHLFDRLKYPRSAYQHKKDIPYVKSNIGAQS